MGGSRQFKILLLKKERESTNLAVEQSRGQVQGKQVITSGKLNPTTLSVPICKMETSKVYSIAEKSEFYLAKMPSTLTLHRHSICSLSCGAGLGGGGIQSSS